MCVCVTAVFRCFHIEKSPNCPVSFAQWFSWVGGFLLSLISRLNSLCKCPNEHFGLLFRTPHTQEIDGLTLPGRPSTLIDCRPRIDAVLSPVFGKWPPKHAFDERSKNSVVLHPNGQFRALEKPPFWPSFSTGALWFTGWCALFGMQPVLVAFVTTLGWWSVASVTFTRKCLLHGASDCGCGNGFLFSRRLRPVSDRCRSFASVRKMTSEVRIRREKKKIRSFCVQTVSLEPWRSRHFGLLSRPEPCRSESVLFLACSQFWRPSWRHCSWERCQSDIHSKMFAPCFRLRMWEWLSLSRRPRPVSQSLQSALSWFQSALACFVCSVLRFADAGMAFSLAKDRDLYLCGMKCPSHWSHAVGRVRSFYQTLRECWMWKTPFCVVNSLQSHWRRGKRRTFFVEYCQRLGPVWVSSLVFTNLAAWS